MRPEGSPLDLNNLPEEYWKQAMEESSTTTATSSDIARYKKKKSGGKEGKDESGKVYECRFCSLKFCKSQALGGHMNRHRQERETETLNRARQLVFSSEGLVGAGAGAHLSPLGLREASFGSGSSQPMPSGCFQQHGGGAGDPCRHFRPLYPRLPTPLQPHLQTYIFPPSSSRPLSYSAPYPPPPPSDFYMRHVLTGTSLTQPQNMSNAAAEPNYVSFGASLGQSIPAGGFRAPVTDAATPVSRTDGANWSNWSYGYDN